MVMDGALRPSLRPWISPRSGACARAGKVASTSANARTIVVKVFATLTIVMPGLAPGIHVSAP
jgi:hypothetical protein